MLKCTTHFVPWLLFKHGLYESFCRSMNRYTSLLVEAHWHSFHVLSISREPYPVTYWHIQEPQMVQKHILVNMVGCLHEGPKFRK